jgi:hypothetical protein
LTCDFWAENAEKKISSMENGLDSCSCEFADQDLARAFSPQIMGCAGFSLAVAGGDGFQPCSTWKQQQRRKARGERMCTCECVSLLGMITNGRCAPWVGEREGREADFSTALLTKA